MPMRVIGLFFMPPYTCLGRSPKAIFMPTGARTSISSNVRPTTLTAAG